MDNFKSNSGQNQYRQLRAFCMAAKTGSISKAASRLQLSQPSVSLQIQALEKELQILLFERRGPKICLTPAGQLLLDMAEPLVAGIDNLVESFAAAVSEVSSGPLDIASGDDTVDFAIGAMDEVPEDLLYYPIYNYPPILIMPEDHELAKRKSVTPKDISPHGLILPPRSLSTLNQIDGVFRQHGLPCHVVLEVGGWEVIKRYVELGLGISIVTSFCLRGHERLVTIPVDKYFPSRSFGVVMRRGKFLSPQAKAFLEFMDADFFSADGVYGRPEVITDKEVATLHQLKEQLAATEIEK